MRILCKTGCCLFYGEAIFHSRPEEGEKVFVDKCVELCAVNTVTTSIGFVFILSQLLPL
jgi:hypothetical protein